MNNFALCSNMFLISPLTFAIANSAKMPSWGKCPHRLVIFSVSIREIPNSVISGSRGTCILIWTWLDYFPKTLLQFIFLPTMYKSVLFYVSLRATLSFLPTWWIFLKKRKVLQFLHIFIGSLSFSSCEKSAKSLPIFLLDCLCFSFSVGNFCVLRILTFHLPCVCKYFPIRDFLPSLVLSLKTKYSSSCHRRMHPICCLLGHLASLCISSSTD